MARRVVRRNKKVYKKKRGRKTRRLSVLDRTRKKKRRPAYGGGGGRFGHGDLRGVPGYGNNRQVGSKSKREGGSGVGMWGRARQAARYAATTGAVMFPEVARHASGWHRHFRQIQRRDYSGVVRYRPLYPRDGL